jgi:sigma-54 specific flagellar transcriptional regulator A
VIKSEEKTPIIGNSTATKQLLSLVSQYASSSASVLIMGRTGTGKELVSRELHRQSSRHSEKFIAINCGAIPSQLLESELFGHRKGSFTGAICDRKGRFELANKGTLFLDEIGDMPLELQVKFLRVLEERVFEPVGGGSEIVLDVRIIAASHKNLEEMISNGSFREDLFFRLNVLPLLVATLAERSDDIPELLSYFGDKYSINSQRISFTRRSLYILQAYSWPGNIRELSNFCQRMSVLYPGKKIDLTKVPKEFIPIEIIELNQELESLNDDNISKEKDNLNDSCANDLFIDESNYSLFETDRLDSNEIDMESTILNDYEQIIELSNTISVIPPEGIPTKDLLGNLEASLIRTALIQTGQNVSKAAELLQLGRTSLIQKITKYGLGIEN